MKNLSAFFTLSVLALNLFTISTVNADEMQDNLRRGISLLYKDQTPTPDCKPGETCPDSIDQEQLVRDAVAMKDEYDHLVQNYKPTDLKWSQVKPNIMKFQMASPVQKPDAPENQIYGFVYSPNVPYGCDIKFPATLFIHHVGNDLKNEQMMAEFAAKMSKGVVMLIYLPNYGPRKKDPKSPPINADLHIFRDSLFQALTDIHVSGELLKTLPMVDPKQIQLGGLSLGALVTVISAGIDPMFDRYFVGLGGGDVAGVLGFDKSKTDSQIRKTLDNFHWNTDESRKELAPLDALTWAYQVKNKKFVMLAAAQDEIVNKQQSVDKLAEAYRENNQVNLRVHAGGHVPDFKKLGYKKGAGVYLEVVSQMINFMGDSKAGEIARCAGEQH